MSNAPGTALSQNSRASKLHREPPGIESGASKFRPEAPGASWTIVRARSEPLATTWTGVRVSPDQTRCRCRSAGPLPRSSRISPPISPRFDFLSGCGKPAGSRLQPRPGPQGVLRQGEIIRERLLSTGSELSPARWVRSPLGRQELADEIDELRLFVQRLVEQRKRVDTAKVRKDRTIEELDRQFITIARVLEATFPRRRRDRARRPHPPHRAPARPGRRPEAGERPSPPMTAAPSARPTEPLEILLGWAR